MSMLIGQPSPTICCIFRPNGGQVLSSLPWCQKGDDAASGWSVWHIAIEVSSNQVVSFWHRQDWIHQIQLWTRSCFLFLFGSRRQERRSNTRGWVRPKMTSHDYREWIKSRNFYLYSPYICSFSLFYGFFIYFWYEGLFLIGKLYIMQEC